eukprot:GHVP01068504.1.p1 GENE.GHVP01068504.1~~GHVP01068504.1.p1  ORF type:complete len:753 (+),score=138.07 GHVP01068504.1:2-2260(+)
MQQKKKESADEELGKKLLRAVKAEDVKWKNEEILEILSKECSAIDEVFTWVTQEGTDIQLRRFMDIEKDLLDVNGISDEAAREIAKKTFQKTICRSLINCLVKIKRKEWCIYDQDLKDTIDVYIHFASILFFRCGIEPFVDQICEEIETIEGIDHIDPEKDSKAMKDLKEYVAALVLLIALSPSPGKIYNSILKKLRGNFGVEGTLALVYRHTYKKIILESIFNPDLLFQNFEWSKISQYLHSKIDYGNLIESFLFSSAADSPAMVYILIDSYTAHEPVSPKSNDSSLSLLKSISAHWCRLSSSAMHQDNSKDRLVCVFALLRLFWRMNLQPKELGLSHEIQSSIAQCIGSSLESNYDPIRKSGMFLAEFYYNSITDLAKASKEAKQKLEFRELKKSLDDHFFQSLTLFNTKFERSEKKYYTFYFEEFIDPNTTKIESPKPKEEGRKGRKTTFEEKSTYIPPRHVWQCLERLRCAPTDDENRDFLSVRPCKKEESDDESFLRVLSTLEYIPRFVSDEYTAPVAKVVSELVPLIIQVGHVVDSQLEIINSKKREALVACLTYYPEESLLGVSKITQDSFSSLSQKLLGVLALSDAAQALRSSGPNRRQNRFGPWAVKFAYVLLPRPEVIVPSYGGAKDNRQPNTAEKFTAEKLGISMSQTMMTFIECCGGLHDTDKVAVIGLEFSVLLLSEELPFTVNNAALALLALSMKNLSAAQIPSGLLTQVVRILESERIENGVNSLLVKALRRVVGIE